MSIIIWTSEGAVVVLGNLHGCKMHAGVYTGSCFIRSQEYNRSIFST